MSYSEQHSPILTITTSKNWVLPPRPKNSRKNRAASEKKKQKPPAATGPSKNEQPTISHPKKNIPSPHHKSPLTQPSLPVKLPAGPLSAPMAAKRPGLQTKPSVPSDPPAYHQKPHSTPSSLGSVHELKSHINETDRENYNLKTKLLSLIHDYRCLKSQVDSASSPSFHAGLYDTATTARKRVFNEMGDGIMSDLISDLNHLSHATTLSPLEQETDPEQSEAELFNFVNIDLNSSNTLKNQGLQDSEKISGSGFPKDSGKDIIDEFVYSEAIKSPIHNASSHESSQEKKALEDVDEEIDDDFIFLSRSTSPLVSETDENSLMTSLTRSTTVSTNNSSMDKKSYTKFFDLPVFSEDDDGFSFEHATQNDKVMSVIEEDHYNQVADFLEEKLMSNDIKYYVNSN